MKRTMIAAVTATILGIAGTTFAANPEPLGITMLRIEMKKALMQQDVAPKMTQLRQRKVQELQAAGKVDEAADAEVELIQAQTTEAVSAINLKQLDLQLKEALRVTSGPPLGAGGPQGGQQGGPGVGQPSQPGQGGQPGANQEPAASPVDISMLQFDVQKAKLQADAAAKIADNRQRLQAAKKERAQKGIAADSTDAEAEVLSAQTSARMAQLDVEAVQTRLDAAVKSTQQK